MSSRLRMWRCLPVLALTAICMAMLFNGVAQSEAQADRPVMQHPSAAPGGAVLYRFNPTTHQFITISLLNGSHPSDVAVTGLTPAQVWVAEYGGDRITKVVFTDTTHYQRTEYPVGSRPYRLAASGNFIWFTERGANRIGRLNTTTGAIDEFYAHGLSPNAGLSDIKVAPNGHVWVGAEEAKRLVRLTITSTQVYAFSEYTDTLRPAFVVEPYAIAIENNNSILMTAPHVPTPTMRLAQFTPSARAFQWPTFLTNRWPYEVVVVSGTIWFSDWQRNELVQAELGTFPILNSYGPITRPTALAAESSNVFWSVLQTIPSSISRLEEQPGTPPTTTVTSFVLPDTTMSASAIAVAADGGIWVSAYYQANLYLPLIRKS